MQNKSVCYAENLLFFSVYDLFKIIIIRCKNMYELFYCEVAANLKNFTYSLMVKAVIIPVETLSFISQINVVE